LLPSTECAPAAKNGVGMTGRPDLQRHGVGSPRTVPWLRPHGGRLEVLTESLENLYAQKPQWKLFQDTARATALLRDAGPFIDMVYPSRMKTPFLKTDRDYVVYEFSRPGVAEAIANYFKYDNGDLEAAVTKIAENRFAFPVLQLQADSDPAQPVSSFADVPTLLPNIRLPWIPNAGHFDNLDQPKQVADAINAFITSTR